MKIKNLSINQQKELEIELRRNLSFEFAGSELEEAVKEGMKSKLKDVEEYVQAEKYYMN